MNRCICCGRNAEKTKTLTGYGNVCTECADRLKYAAVLIRENGDIELVPSETPLPADTGVTGLEQMLGKYGAEPLYADIPMLTDRKCYMLVGGMSILDGSLGLNGLASWLNGYGRNPRKQGVYGDCMIVTFTDPHVPEFAGGSRYMMDIDTAIALRVDLIIEDRLRDRNVSNPAREAARQHAVETGCAGIRVFIPRK